MVWYYMKHAWRMLWQDKIFTIVSLLGTGMAVAFIMVIFSVNTIEDAPMAPESNRNRMLYVTSARIESKTGGVLSGRLSPVLIRSVFYPLEGVETVSAMRDISAFVEMRKFSGEGKTIHGKSTDGNYWKCFDFDFLDGKPFTTADFESGIKVAVISESASRNLFKGDKAVGKTFYIAYQPYKVVGVVRDINPLFGYAYADVWFPYSTDAEVISVNNTVIGFLSVVILTKHAADFKAIIQHVEREVKRYNQPILSDGDIHLGGPENHEESRYRTSSNAKKSDYGDVIKIRMATIAMLLVIPALNIAGFTLSRMRKRQQELGIRRSYGAGRSSIMWQVISENMVLSLLGGIVGFVISILLIILFQKTLFLGNAAFSMAMFLRFDTILYLLLICLMVNLLSSLWPAFRSAKQPIIIALKSKRL